MSTATTTESSVQFVAPGTGNIWLSGASNGTVTQNLRPDDNTIWDTAGGGSTPKQTPGEASSQGFDVSHAGAITIDGLTGTASNDDDGSIYTADGNNGWIVFHGGYTGNHDSNWPLSDNGIANVKAPISSMIGVFLPAGNPSAGSVPAALDFTTPASRDYQSLSPQVKQPFFIGDGRRANGETQTIVVPHGAKKLYIGIMDAWQWNDNQGGFTVTLHDAGSISTVR
jgi:hypothetical protein